MQQHGRMSDGRMVIINDQKIIMRDERSVDQSKYAEVLLDGHWQIVRREKLEPLGYGYKP